MYVRSVTWNFIPTKLRKASSYQLFKSEIKKWEPTNFLPGYEKITEET